MFISRFVFLIALLCLFLPGCAKTGPDNFEVNEATIEEGLKTGRIYYVDEPAGASDGGAESAGARK